MKHKFQVYVMAVCFTFLAALTYAQPPGPPPGEKREEIEAMKVGFLTRKLELNTEEAKTFWPVYNQYQSELDRIRENRRKDMKASREEFDSMSDKDFEKIVDGEIAFRQAELDVMKKYNSQFKQVLPMKKVAKLYRAEEDFKRELLQRIQERRDKDGPDRQRRK
jgi:hypothetical protein